MFPKTKTERLAAPVIEQCMSLEASERYALFLEYVTHSHEVCLLQGESGFVMFNKLDTEQLPVFPHRDLALHWLNAQDSETAHTDTTHVEPVDLTMFTETWLPGLKKNHIDLVIFPSSMDGSSHCLSADELIEDLSDNDNA